MNLSNRLILTFITTSIFGLSIGCTSIKNYSTVEIRPDTSNIYVLTPSPQNLEAYDLATAQQWERTYNHCIQIKNAIAKEIDQRESRLAKRKNWLLIIGGFAGLANAIYTGVEDDTKKIVTVPLGTISGIAILTFLPALSKDERLSMLKKKLEKLNSLQKQAENAMLDVDKALLDKALLDQNFEREKDEKKKEIIEQQINYTIKRVDVLIGTLKRILLDWSTEAL